MKVRQTRHHRLWCQQSTLLYGPGRRGHDSSAVAVQHRQVFHSKLSAARGSVRVTNKKVSGWWLLRRPVFVAWTARSANIEKCSSWIHLLSVDLRASKLRICVRSVSGNEPSNSTDHTSLGRQLCHPAELGWLYFLPTLWLLSQTIQRPFHANIHDGGLRISYDRTAW